ncbi:MAG: hypothetical protein AB1782_07930 [Cyanobacteriota bacterium]
MKIKTYILLIILSVLTLFALFNLDEKALAQVRPTNEQIQSFIKDYLRSQGKSKYPVKVVGLGSWITNSNYRDPLNLDAGKLPSDHDLRLIIPDDMPQDQAIKKWKEFQNFLRKKIASNYSGDQMKTVLNSVTVYPPNQLIENISNNAEAVDHFNNVLKGKPNIGEEAIEGYFGKHNEPFRQHYELTKGKEFYLDGKNVVKTSTDLQHIAEGGYTSFTTSNQARSAEDAIEHVSDVMKKNDIDATIKQLGRVDKSLKKAKDLKRIPHHNNIDDVIKKLKDLPPGEIPADFVEQVNKVLKDSSTEAKLLQNLDHFWNNNSIKEAQLIAEMLNPKPTSLSASIKNKLWDLAGKIPADKFLKVVEIGLVSYDIYDAVQSASQEEYDKAYRSALIGALGVAEVGLLPLAPAIIADIFIDYTKEKGYNLIASAQDCENLMVGICDSPGRAPETINKPMRDYSAKTIFENDQPTNSQEYISIVQDHLQLMAHHCSVRGNNSKDRKIEQPLYDRCLKQFLKEWNEYRIKKMGDVSILESDYINKISSSTLGLSAEPDPAKLPEKENGKESEVKVSVSADYNLDNKAATDIYTKMNDNFKILGGKSHLTQIQIETTYLWKLDGKEISIESSYYSGGISGLFESDKAIKEFTFNKAGVYKVDLEFTIKIDFVSGITPAEEDIVRDIVERLNMDQIITKQTSIDITVIDDPTPQGKIKITGPEKLKKDEVETITVDLEGEIKQLTDLNINWYIDEKTGDPINLGKEFKYSVPKDKKNVTFFVTVTDKPVSSIIPVTSKTTEKDKKEEIKIIAEDSKTFEIGFDSLKDQIEEAYKNKDWKKLFEIHSQKSKFKESLSPEDTKLCEDYLKNLLDEYISKYQKVYSDVEKKQDEDIKAYELFVKETKKSIAELNEQKKGQQARELQICLDKIDIQRGQEETRFKNTLDRIKYFLDSVKDYNPQHPQDYYFKDAEKLPLKLDIDISKPIKIADYKGLCSDKKALEKLNKVIISLRALKTKLKPGEIVTLAAVTDGRMSMCPDAETYTWTGHNFGSNNTFEEVNEVDFMSSKEGVFDIGVTVSCMDSTIGSDSITIKVGGAVTGKIQGLDNEVNYNSKKNLSVNLDIPSSDIDTSGIKIVWDSSPNLTFDPKESKNGDTTVTFDRMEDPVKIWAQILNVDNGISTTLGEVEQQEVKVIPPKFTIVYDTLQKDAKIGTPVIAEIKSDPDIDSNLIDYRWIEPTDRKEIDNGKIEFVLKDDKPIKLQAIARVPTVGDIINDSINDTYSAGAYKVIARVIGPKYDTPVKVWNKKKGLVEVTKDFTVDQEIIIEADIDGANNIDILYDWSVDQDCSIVGVDNSKELTITKHEVGVCTAKIEVYDKDKNKLGEAEVNVDITVSQDMIDQASSKGDPDKTADKGVTDKTKDKGVTDKTKDKSVTDKTKDKSVTDKTKDKSVTDKTKDKSSDKTKDKSSDKAKEKDSNKELAKKKLKEAVKDYNSSKIDEALEKAQEAATLDPKNSNIKDFLNKVKSEKERYLTLANSAKDLINQNKLDDARAIFSRIPSNFQNYPPIKEIFDMIAQKETDKNNLSYQLRQDQNTALKLSSECKYDEAIAMTEKIIEQDPFKGTYKEFRDAKHWLDQFTKNKATMEDLIQKAKVNIAQKDYKNAYQNAFTANSINPNCPDVGSLLAEAEKNKNQPAPVQAQSNNVVPIAPGPGPVSTVPIVPITPGPGPVSTVPMVPVAPGPNQVPIVPIVPIAPTPGPISSTPMVPQVYNPVQTPPIYNTPVQATPKPNINDVFDSVMGQVKTNKVTYNEKRNTNIYNNQQPTQYPPGLQVTEDSNDTSLTSTNTGSTSMTDRLKDLSQQTYIPKPNVNSNQSPCTTPCNTTQRVNPNTVPTTNTGSTPCNTPCNQGPATSNNSNILGSWKVGAITNGQKQPVHHAPWVFSSNGTVEAPGYWKGTWRDSGNRVLMSMTYNGIASNCEIAVESGGNAFTAYENGQPFRHGTRTGAQISNNTPIQKAPVQQNSNSPPVSLAGKWYVVACGYSANLEITGSPGAMVGKINYHQLNSWENIVNIQYNSSTGQVYFKREKYPQTHTGTVRGNKMSGTMTRDDLRGNAMCNWEATRQ